MNHQSMMPGGRRRNNQQSMSPSRQGNISSTSRSNARKTRDAHQSMAQKGKKNISGLGGYDTKRRSVNPRDCYITSACVSGVGLPDDCDDLRLIRRFRDSYVTTLPEGEQLLSEYRDRAPAIVDAIDGLGPEASRAVYKDLHESGISPAVDLIRAGRWDQALELYRSICAELAARFGLPDTRTNPNSPEGGRK